MIESYIKLTTRLYECRDTCKKLWGEKWKEHVEFHTKLINMAMKKYNLDEIKTAMKLIEESQHMDGSDIFTIKILAAAVEIIEPNS